MDSKQHIDTVLIQVRDIFEKASVRIDALLPGEKIPATKLAEDLANELGMKGAALYPTLLFLFKGYPGIEIKRGAHGGLVKVIPKAVVVTPIVNVADEAMENENDK